MENKNVDNTSVDAKKEEIKQPENFSINIHADDLTFTFSGPASADLMIIRNVVLRLLTEIVKNEVISEQVNAAKEKSKEIKEEVKKEDNIKK